MTEQLRALGELFAHSSELLDAGGGFNTWLRRLPLDGRRCVVVDRAGDEGTLLSVDGTPITLRSGRAEQLPFPTGSFDAVLSPAVLSYTVDPSTALQEYVRVLGKRRPATIAILEPHVDNGVVRSCNAGCSVMGLPPADHGWLIDHAARELAAAGFQVELRELAASFRLPDGTALERIRFLTPLLVKLRFAGEAHVGELEHVIADALATHIGDGESSLRYPMALLHATAR